jgi:hypothetical protein
MHLMQTPASWTRLAALLAATAIFGCSVGVSEDECDPREPCVCDGVGACTRACTGPGCNFYCEGQGACSFDCPEGGCDAFGYGQGTVEMSCAGNGCTLTCSGQGTCELRECTDNCAANCSGQGTCTNTCTAASCG